MLELTNVRLRADHPDGFDHHFEAGQISVVLGTNQSGKTDLCRLITGLQTAARGRIRLDGTDWDKLSPQQRPVSLVYQAFVNYPNLTVSENIASPLRARRLSSGDIKSRVTALAENLQISELLQRLPHELSGGQQQRLAIARALAKDARVLLLDEPLANLDFKLREALEYELRELLIETKTVVVYTSSDPRDAFTLGDQVLMLEDGRKIQAGAPIDVYRSPNNIAAMELLAEPFVNRFADRGRSCALRPEHLVIGAAGAANTAIDFNMHVTAYETNGDESFIHGVVNENDWVIRCHGMQKADIGSALNLHAQLADVVRF